MKYLVLVLVLLIGTISAAYSAMPEKASADFTNKFECDAVPAGPDFAGGLGGGALASADGGILTISCPTESATAFWYWDAMDTATASANAVSIEIKIKLLADSLNASKTHGVYVINVPWGRNLLQFDENRIVQYSDASTLALADATDDYHVYRVATTKPSGTDSPIYQVWRDGIELGLTQPLSYGKDRTYFIDGSGAFSGTEMIDYIRFDTTGAYAPVGAVYKEAVNIIASLQGFDTLTDLNLYRLKVAVYKADGTLVSENIVQLDSTTAIVDGKYAITKKLLPGDYKVVVSAPKWLTKIVPFTVTAGVTLDIPEITLLNGDITGDGKVNVSDYNVLKGNWFKIGDTL